MQNKNTAVSIIIVNYHSPDLLRLCLGSIAQYLSLRHEVLVVDSHTSRATQDIVLEEFPQYRLIPIRENVGYARGVNRGIARARYNYLLIINPDIIITKGSVEKLIERIERGDDIGLIGPRLLHFNGLYQQSCFAFYTPMTVVYRRTILGKTARGKKKLAQFLLTRKNLEQEQEVDWIMGSALLTKKSFLKNVGNMNESFFMYFEDVEWAKRFWQNGYKVLYYPKSAFYHYHKQESKTKLGIFDAVMNKKARWHIHSAIKFFLMHPFPRRDES